MRTLAMRLFWDAILGLVFLAEGGRLLLTKILWKAKLKLLVVEVKNGGQSVGVPEWNARSRELGEWPG